MSVQIDCPNPDCDASIQVAEENLGELGQCEKCGKEFPLVPGTRVGDILSISSISQTDPDPIPRSPEAKLPEWLGHFKVVRLLGQGGMGSVYLAEDTKLRKPVAIKVPHSHVLDRPEVGKRFFVEAQAAAQFHHPNFCPIYHMGEADRVPYLVMAYIEGKTLGGWIDQNQGWPPRRAAEVVRELALALAEAHRKGIIHRDLKPANIMVDAEGRMVLMDFGLARWYETVDSSLTPTGTVLGTPAYMSPEQADADLKAIGPRSDIYSLGVILYELLTGRQPFEGSFLAVLRMVAYDDPAPPSKYVPGLDLRLQAICLKAMAKKPEDRYASMDEFAEELKAFLGEPPGETQDKVSRVELNDSKILIRTVAISSLVLTAILFGITFVAINMGRTNTGDEDRRTGTAPSVVDGPRRASPPATPIDEPPITNKIGMKLNLIRAGEFDMGAADGEPEAGSDEQPRHKVQISRPFYLGVYEVTQGEYNQVMETNPSWFSPTGKGQAQIAGIDTNRLPVENVSWLDAIAFCNKLSELEELKPCYKATGEPIVTGTGYRLPTEAEWEYACRAGSTTPFSFGTTITPANANFDGKYTYNGSVKGEALERPSFVHTCQSNAFGLYSMHGNVWEWCADWYDASYYAKLPSVAKDPQNLIPAALRVYRGGSWLSSPQNCRTANRNGIPPDEKSYDLGFRVVRIRLEN